MRIGGLVIKLALPRKVTRHDYKRNYNYTLFVRPMRLSHKTTEALTDSSASKTFMNN
jgi:hypothetical protein